jgi:hypothetical protein
LVVETADTGAQNDGDKNEGVHTDGAQDDSDHQGPEASTTLRVSDELDEDALSADQLVWAPTPPPGISPEDFATPRKGLFRKKKQ